MNQDYKKNKKIYNDEEEWRDEQQSDLNKSQESEVNEKKQIQKSNKVAQNYFGIKAEVSPNQNNELPIQTNVIQK